MDTTEELINTKAVARHASWELRILRTVYGGEVPPAVADKLAELEEALAASGATTRKES